MKTTRLKALNYFVQLYIVLNVVSHTIGFSIKNSANSSTFHAPIKKVASMYTVPVPEHRKSNLEMLLSLNPAFMLNSAAKLKSDIGTVKERGVVPVTFEEDDPLPLPNLNPPTSAPTVVPSETVIINSSDPESQVPNATNSLFSNVPIRTQPNTTNTVKTGKPSPSATSIEEELFSGIKEDKNRPMTDFQNIKDAYFDLLQQFKEFRKTTSQKISVLEQQLKVHMLSANKSNMMDSMTAKIGDVHEKLIEMDLRHNLTRLMDFCVTKVTADELVDASTIWQKIEMSMPNPSDMETSNILKEIVTTAYTKNKTNENPIYRFLRKLDDVDKMASYEFLLKEMMKRDDFDGAEIFHIAHYLKEHNAVRSPLYARIPRSVQYSVSGRNVNIIFLDGKPGTSGRFYLHVRDDGDRRERHNFYVRASQSYTDSKSAVWRVVYYESTQSFRLRNLLFNDYLIINSEGFLEPTYATNANTLGTEFEFVLEKNQILLRSKSYAEQQLVSTWAGGRFPYYFNLRTVPGNDAKPAAQFLIEPDSLL